jgi:hypothetical protein
MQASPPGCPAPVMRTRMLGVCRIVSYPSELPRAFRTRSVVFGVAATERKTSRSGYSTVWLY